ncbi:ATP-binding cassette domain-containing protein [Clostridium sp. PL3]|uniref:ATP-binding cassette domain-containing protein n=1 Tax=Clostridium thailandense TaxID=2794346 RepID=A0A949WRW5_9CLOT|nr:ATP-binding cassette domain-containing protein [Clostridium thailandense]MBV7274431.1 ATP-binding cassette domain-containing protein [Clostridium thailandense]
MKISTENLNMTYSKETKALQDISLKIEGPGVVGILGPKDAGKSTLIKLLIGELQAESGRIFVDDIPLFKIKTKLKETLGYLPQSLVIYDELNVWQFLDYIAVLKKIKNRKKAIKEVLQKTNLIDKQEAYISTLSVGEKQQIGIAQALLGIPKLLIFDEPTARISKEEISNFYKLISQTAKESTILLATNVIEDMESICDKLVVISEGRILFNGNPEDLLSLVSNNAQKLTFKAAYIQLIGKEVLKL